VKKCGKHKCCLDKDEYDLILVNIKYLYLKYIPKPPNQVYTLTRLIVEEHSWMDLINLTDLHVYILLTKIYYLLLELNGRFFPKR